jgi:hypothetical protein
MTRQVTDQLYIDLEYFTPEEYYTYIAEASASISAEFTQSVQGYRTVETVLSAFSDAALTADVEVIKSSAVSVSSEFSLEASASGFENAEAALTATATMDCVVTKIVSGLADISAEFTQITVAERVVNFNMAFESSVTMDTQATRTVTFGVGLSSDAACSCVNFRVRDFDSAVGALFNTAVSASATINSFAVLDSVSALTADAVVNRSTAVTLEVNATVIANVLSFSNQSASLTSAFAVNASGIISNRRPRQVIPYNSPTFSTTKKFGSHSLILGNDGTNKYLDTYASSDWTAAKTWDFWINPAGSFGNNNEIAIYEHDSGSNYFYINLRLNVVSSITYYRISIYSASGGVTGTYTSALTANWTNFKHVRVVLGTGTNGITVWIDGTKDTPFSTSGTILYPNITSVTPKIGRPYVSGNGLYYIDDYWISKSQLSISTENTFTVPTSARQLTETQQNNTVFLFHFDNDYVDDLTQLEQAQASLTATSTLTISAGMVNAGAALLASSGTVTVSATVTKNYQSNLSSAFAVSASVNTLYDINGSLFNSATLSSNVERFRTTSSDLQAQSQLTVDTIRIQRAASDLSTEFTQVADVQRTRTAASALASQFTLTADVDLVADINSSLSAEFTQSAAADRTRSTAVSLTAEFALDTANQRVRYAESAQSSEFALTAESQRVQQAASDLSSEFTQSTDIERFRKTPADLSSESTQSTAVDRIRYGLGDLNTEFTQVADAIRIQQGHADISAAFEQTTTANRTRNLDSAQSTQADITINAVKTVNVAVTTEAIATQLTAAAKIGDFLIDCAVTASVSCSGSRVRFFENLSEPRGVNLQDDVTGTDLGPFLLLDTYPSGTSLFVTRSLISFWTNEGTTGAILNTDGVYDGNPSGTNIFTITKEGSDYFLYYYGNRAQEAIYPYVKWAIDYRNEDLLHNFLIYIESGGFPTQEVLESYRFFLDGVEQTQLAVTDAYVEPKKSHPFTIKDGLLLGYGSSFYALGGGSGYTPHGNLENTAPNSAVLAQFWMDNNTTYDLDDSDLRNKFYNAGWTDLGVDGTATGLSRPDYYVRLNGYQDLDEQGTVSAANNNWSWRYFNNRRVVSGVPLYDVSGFAATPDQDNPYVTQIVASLTLKITVAALFAANLQSTSTLSATVERIQANSAALSSEFTQTANIAVNIGTITNISSQTALAINAGYLLEATSTQNSLFTVQATVGAIGDNSVDMVSAFAVSADVEVIPPIRIEADLAGQFAVQAITGFEQQAQADLSSAFAVTADVDSIPPVRIEANLSSEFAVTASIQGQFDNQASLDSEFTQTTSGGRIRRPSASLSAQATLIANNSKLVGFSANLPAVATQLIVGSLIHIDPFYQYKVESETRRGTVLPENRVFQVESETRVNMIL